MQGSRPCRATLKSSPHLNHLVSGSGCEFSKQILQGPCRIDDGEIVSFFLQHVCQLFYEMRLVIERPEVPAHLRKRHIRPRQHQAVEGRLGS